MPAVDTKDRILDVAERIFADKGFAETSLRSITAEAGVNLAAVNYHFGSKEALLNAVFERRINPINEQRLAELDAFEAEAGDAPVALEKVLRALLGPPVRLKKEWGEGGNRFIQLAGRAHSDPNPQVRNFFLGLFRRVIERFLPAFQRALPHVPEHEIPIRVHFVIGAMAHTMAWSQHVPDIYKSFCAPPDPEELLERLVAFAAAGMSVAASGKEKGDAR